MIDLTFFSQSLSTKPGTRISSSASGESGAAYLRSDRRVCGSILRPHSQQTVSKPANLLAPRLPLLNAPLLH